jgi:outer membrane protein assembly factor BamB
LKSTTLGRALAVAGLALATALVSTAAATAATAGPPPAATRPHAITCGSSACDWPEFHQTPALTGDASNSSLSVGNAGQLGVAWATDLFGPALDSPVVAYDATLGKTLAYVGTENGDLEAIDVATGEIVWGTWVGSPIRTTPAVSDGAVWFGTFDSPRIYKVDASTGAIDCSIAAPQPIEGTPVVADPPGGVPTVYIGNNDSSAASGPLLAIAASDCSMEWEFTAYDEVAGTWTAAAYTLDASGEPLIVFGTADPDSTVYAIDAVTGTTVWKYTVANPPPGVYDIGAGTLVSPPGVNGFADGAVYVPTKYGIMYALDLSTGAPIWTTNFNQIAGTVEGGRSTAALDGDNLVFGYTSGMFDLNAVTGAVIWQYVDPTKSEALSSPAIAGPAGKEVVAVGELAGAFDVVSLATGAELYHYQTAGYVTASPAVSGGNVLIASSDGYLYDFAAGGGNEPTPPSTTVTSPSDGSTLANPNGNLTIEGTASDGAGVSGVTVAIQENGPSGAWWDAATGTWSSGPVSSAATVASPGAPSSDWSYTFPAPTTGGAYSITAYTQSVGGQSDVAGAHAGISILGSTKGAHIKASPAFVAPGANLTITGSGFTPGETITLALVGTTLGTATATSKGNLAATKVKVPASAAFGLTSVSASGATSGRTAAAAVTIANNWDQLGYGPGRTGFEPNDPTFYNLVHPGTNIFVDLAWSYQTAAAVDTSPAVADGVAYVGDGAGNLTAIDVHNGAPIWTWQLPSDAALAGSPAVDPVKGVVVVGADDGTLDAVSTASGKLLWSATIGGDVSAPVEAGGNVYVTSTNGVVEALSETTGAERWSETLASPSSAAPALDSTAKKLVVGEANGHVQELSATDGALGWVFDAAGAVTTTPAIYAGSVFFGSAGKKVYSVSESAGTQTWSFTTTGPVQDTPSLTNQITPGHLLELVVGDKNGHLYFLQASSGSLNYANTFSGSVVGVATVKGVAFATLSSGMITSTRSYSDLDVWKYQTHGALATTPVLDDGTVLVGAGDGHLYAFTSYGQPPA